MQSFENHPTSETNMLPSSSWSRNKPSKKLECRFIYNGLHVIIFQNMEQFSRCENIGSYKYLGVLHCHTLRAYYHLHSWIPVEIPAYTL